MNQEACPSRVTLRAWLDLELDLAEDRSVGNHVSLCDACRDIRHELEPATILADAPPTTLSEGDWADVMRAVRIEVAARPRRRLRDRLAAWLLTPALAPVGVALAAALFLAASIVVRAPAPKPIDEGPRVAELAPMPKPMDEGPLVRIDDPFKLLSNLDAQVDHMILAGAELGVQERLTLVVDASIAELF